MEFNIARRPGLSGRGSGRLICVRLIRIQVRRRRQAQTNIRAKVARPNFEIDRIRLIIIVQGILGQDLLSDKAGLSRMRA